MAAASSTSHETASTTTTYVISLICVHCPRVAARCKVCYVVDPDTDPICSGHLWNHYAWVHKELYHARDCVNNGATGVVECDCQSRFDVKQTSANTSAAQTEIFTGEDCKAEAYLKLKTHKDGVPRLVISVPTFAWMATFDQLFSPAFETACDTLFAQLPTDSQATLCVCTNFTVDTKLFGTDKTYAFNAPYNHKITWSDGFPRHPVTRAEVQLILLKLLACRYHRQAEPDTVSGSTSDAAKALMNMKQSAQ
jgi:hypothetical protein